MKKIFSLLLILSILTGCFASDQVGKPTKEVRSLEEAIELAGFSITLPTMIDGFDTITYKVDPDIMIEVTYENNDDYIIIRKQPTKAEVNISGHLNNEFSGSWGDGKYTIFHLYDQYYQESVWYKDGYSYSIYKKKTESQDYLYDLSKQVS